MDRAPTNPNERANEDLTIVIITQIDRDKGIMDDIICLPPDILWLEYLYEKVIKNPNKPAKKEKWKHLLYLLDLAEHSYY